MKNRRKYDHTNIHDLLVEHMEQDDNRFNAIDTSLKENVIPQLMDIQPRLRRIEMAQYIAAAGLAMFIFLIEHPNIVKTLSFNEFPAYEAFARAEK